MTKTAISVTLDGDNLLWLKGRAGARGVRSVSALLNELVTTARQAGYRGSIRSVMGTIDIDAADPGLDHADQAVRALFDASIARSFSVRETRPAARGRLKKRKRRG
jgi:hypothetical protein